MLVILAALVALLWVVKKLEVIVVPVLVALLVSALLLPVVDWLDRRGLPRGGAVALVLLGGFAILGGILAFVVIQFIDGLPGLTEQVTHSIESTRQWLIHGPAHLRGEQIDNAGNAAIEALRNNQAKLDQRRPIHRGHHHRGGHRGGVGAVHADLLPLRRAQHLAYVTKIFPADVRDRVREAGRAGYGSLTGYVRATFLVALTDAAGVGTGLAIMGIPLALPLASLVFLGAFIPLVGALISGLLAVVVALLAKGIVYALITLGVLIAVNQLEAHVLQPLVMGRAVSIHPLGVVLAISTGGVLAGIIGALLAVPTVAFLNNAMQVLLAPDPAAEAEKQTEEADEGGAILQAEPDKPGAKSD